jgi:hypothetical protein
MPRYPPPPPPTLCWPSVPAHSVQGAGPYNGASNCATLIQPIAALFKKYRVPLSRLLVVGMHREERKNGFGASDTLIKVCHSCSRAAVWAPALS